MTIQDQDTNKVSDNKPNDELQNQNIETKFKSLEASVRFSLAESQEKMKESNKSFDLLIKQINQEAVEIAKTAKELEQTIAILCMIPEKITEKVGLITGQLAVEIDELNKKKFSDFELLVNNHFQEANQTMTRYLEKLQSLSKVADETKFKQFKSKVLSAFVVILLAAATSALSTFLVLDNYPSRVSVGKSGDLLIKDSKIEVWGSGNSISTNGEVTAKAKKK